MAENIVAGLFGLPEYDIRQRQQAELEQAAMKNARLDPFQRAYAGMYTAGGNIGETAGGMLGMVNPAIIEAQRKQAAISGLDISDPDAILQRASQIQDPRMKFGLMQLAEQQRDAIAKRKLQEAQAQYYLGGRGTDEQFASKLAVAINDASKLGAAQGLSGKSLEDYVSQRVDQLISLHEATTGKKFDRSAIPMLSQKQQESQITQGISPFTNVELTQQPSKSELTAMYKDSLDRGDTQAANYFKNAIEGVSKQPVYLQSKADVAGQVKSAQEGAKIVSVFDPAQNKTVIMTQAQAMTQGLTPSELSPVAKAGVAAGTETGKTSAERNAKQYTSAISSVEGLNKVNNLLDTLKTGDVISGAAANVRLGIAKVISLLGGKEKAKQATDTEISNAMMGSEVFPLIQSLGIGARGMDTPAEREFLRSVLTGSIGLEKSTLIKMAQLRKQVMESEIDKWNDRIDKGELDNFYQQSDLRKEKIQKPQKANLPSKKFNKITGKWE